MPTIVEPLNLALCWTEVDDSRKEERRDKHKPNKKPWHNDRNQPQRNDNENDVLKKLLERKWQSHVHFIHVLRKAVENAAAGGCVKKRHWSVNHAVKNVVMQAVG